MTATNASSAVESPNGGPPAGGVSGVEAYRQAMARPAVVLALFDRIGDAWALTWPERMALVGVQSRGTYQRWRKDPDSVSLTILQVERLAQVTAIANHLYAVHPGAPEVANTWVRRPNSGRLYGGRTPLELMTSGSTESLIRVREDLADWDRRRRRHASSSRCRYVGWTGGTPSASYRPRSNRYRCSSSPRIRTSSTWRPCCSRAPRASPRSTCRSCRRNGGCPNRTPRR